MALSAAIRAALLPGVPAVAAVRLGSRCADLTAFVDGELTPARAMSFRDHLRLCQACRVAMADQIRLTVALSMLPAPSSAEVRR